MSSKYLKKTYRKIWGSRMYELLPNKFVGEHLLPLFPLFPRLYHTVKSSQSQLVTTPLYTMVNSSHDFRWFEGVTSWPCDKLTGSHSPAITRACWLIRSNTKPPDFHNFVVYWTQVYVTLHISEKTDNVIVWNRVRIAYITSVNPWWTQHL